jgi:Reverse transcriptase (RNA-dependent DNA polymerase)
LTAYNATTAPLNPTFEPPSFQEAVTCEDAPHWIEAMKDEINAMHNNNAWILCDLPPGRKCIGTKWVFKIKRDGNNKFERFRARIVAKGFSQVFAIDFDKTYAPVVRIDTVRHLFALAAFYGLYILHADAKTAFINGNSDVVLYIEQPEGFIDSRFLRKVLRLNKSLYGLKQAPRI